MSASPLEQVQRSIVDIAQAYVKYGDTQLNNALASQAVESYCHALGQPFFDANTMHRSGLEYFRNEKIELACVSLFAAFLASPEREDICEHCGLISAVLGVLTVAEAFYRRALMLAGSTVTLHRNLADCLRRSNRLDEAVVHYVKALDLDPELHHASRALAQIHTELGNPNQAMEFWMRAWLIRPAALKEDLDQIVKLFEAGYAGLIDETIWKITNRFADDASALKAVAYVLNTSKRFEGALRAAKQALRFDPSNAVLCHNVAYALKQLGRIAESRSYSEKAALGLPHEPRIQLYFAEVLLCLGEFESGWKMYRSAYSIPEFKAGLFWPDFPLWNGEPVSGRTFLMVCEQGFGDQIQCLRFAEWLHQQGAIVDVFVVQSVAELAANMPCIRAAYSIMPPGPYDYWSHMFGIPEHMKLDLRMLPVAMPYLSAVPEDVHRWRAWIDAISLPQMPAANRRIGIVWAGNPSLGLDRFRSVQLDDLKPLISLPGTTWYSVQKGVQERQSEALEHEFDVHTLGPSIQSFTDTLAILQSLDLLITVDSSVAHLAGAAGLPVWTLIPAYTDWRWMTDRSDSPWYPSMRLFRQRELGKWAPVIAEVRDALIGWRDETTA